MITRNWAQRNKAIIEMAASIMLEDAEDTKELIKAFKRGKADSGEIDKLKKRENRVRRALKIMEQEFCS